MTELETDLSKLEISNDVALVARDYVVLRSASKSDNATLAIYSIDGILNKIDNMIAKIELFKQNNIKESADNKSLDDTPEQEISEKKSRKTNKSPKSEIKRLNNLSDLNNFLKKIKS